MKWAWIRTRGHDGLCGSFPILSESRQEARVKADNHLLEGGWEVVEFVGHDVVTRENYIGDVNLEYYDQVQIDGEVYVFHTFKEDDE